MQFHIPQYIEIEDKIFGPLTFKQAAYLAGGAGGAYLAYRLAGSYLFIAGPIMLIIIGLALALAFYPKENFGKPFVEILQAGVSYLLKQKLYTWKKLPHEQKTPEFETYKSKQALSTPQVPTGKLSSTSFDLDIKDASRSDDDAEHSHSAVTEGRL